MNHLQVIEGQPSLDDMKVGKYVTNNYQRDVQAIEQLAQKHKDAILMEIFVTENIFHSLLANRLLMSASGLNASIKKINEVFGKENELILGSSSGKFKMYRLNDLGRYYVEKVIMPKIAEEESVEDVLDIWRLMVAFKDKNEGDWNEKLLLLVENEVKTNPNDSYGRGFLENFSGYYRKDAEKAEKLLDLAIFDKELRKVILDNERFKKVKKKNAIEILNQWNAENDEALYDLIDEIFVEIDKKDSHIRAEKFELSDVSGQLETVKNKIMADILQGMLGRYAKWEMAKIWIEAGMDRQLAYHIESLSHQVILTAQSRQQLVV